MYHGVFKFDINRFPSFSIQLDKILGSLSSPVRYDTVAGIFLSPGNLLAPNKITNVIGGADYFFYREMHALSVVKLL